MDGIEFGQVEYREPESELRPDRNRKFAVVACGTVDQSQLPIFVDLDVMRDMEGHARSNLHVELGGVLLGGKFVDENGQPYVVVNEALRAEHYEATRGSFKFTHETWAQITRDRESFPDDLHLVGWYHTHPDWGVFLSGMDTFICENFFSDDLDVDLVIDPCRGDRGWFFWDDVEGARRKQRVSAFHLFTNRYRRTELLKFAEALSAANPAYFDPRYETPMGETAMQPVVNVHEQKSPVLMVAVLGMLTIQMLVLGLIAWRMLFPPATSDYLVRQRQNEVYRDFLGQLLAPPDSTSEDVMQRVEDLAVQSRHLQHDLEGRALMIDQLTNDKALLTQSVNDKDRTLNEKNQALIVKDEAIKDLNTQLAAEKQLNSDIKENRPVPGFRWPIVTVIGLATALLGLIGGAFVGRRFRGDHDYPDDHNREPYSEDDAPTSTPDLTIRDEDHPNY